ncbi:MAG TPA: hypothetical protein VGQ80_01900 [Acidimicrobiia bacterium]|nr:hypothetical protein [Acidimicrobiia bacterium]
MRATPVGSALRMLLAILVGSALPVVLATLVVCGALAPPVAAASGWGGRPARWAGAGADAAFRVRTGEAGPEAL